MDTEAPALPQDALDLLAIGRRYYEVEVEWIPKGDPRCYGRAFGFWSVSARPPGWRARLREAERHWSPVPTAPGRNDSAATCQ